MYVTLLPRRRDSTSATTFPATAATVSARAAASAAVAIQPHPGHRRGTTGRRNAHEGEVVRPRDGWTGTYVTLFSRHHKCYCTQQRPIYPFDRRRDHGHEDSTQQCRHPPVLNPALAQPSLAKINKHQPSKGLKRSHQYRSTHVPPLGPVLFGAAVGRTLWSTLVKEIGHVCHR